MAIDPLTIGMLAILAVLVFFMFRNNKKRQRDAAELQSKVSVGANVMTNFGVYGVIRAIDEDENKILLETSPGNILTVHRQTVTRVITDEPAGTDSDHVLAEPGLNADSSAAELSEPQYGERLESNTPDSTDQSSDDSSKDEAPSDGSAQSKKVDE